MALFSTKRFRAAAMAGLVGSLLLGVVPAQAEAAAVPTFSASGQNITVDGLNVTTTAQIKASSNVTAKVGTCVRGKDKVAFDFPKAQAAPLSAGTAYNYTATQTLAKGSYSYWTCVYYGTTWYQLDATKTFVVTGSDPTVVTTNDTKMPVGDLPGWKQTFSDDFTTNAANGSFLDKYKAKWSAYDGFQDSYKGGTYNEDTLSVNNGLLDMWLHKVNGVNQVSAPVPLVTGSWGGQTYGKFSVRFKSDSISGYKTAWLLWPDSDNWNEGEVDFPEGPLNGKFWGFNHCVGNAAQNCAWVDTATTYTDWHTVSIEWTPSRMTFILDGKVLMNDTNNIPKTPMHWVLQTETTSANAVTQDGHLQIDWVSIYSRVA